MSKMGFSVWNDWDNPCSYVAPKSSYTKEEFERNCEVESDGYYRLGETEEKFARWYPVIPEDICLDGEGGCYGLCQQAKGAFPVWYKDIKPIKKGESV
ncbi:hypothetical protein J2T12_005081 [Paenibacillus anaericanus]|uniref:hypothetical protein n=1 Tax=Paenibacillus anaericanus TaxID=170367 RepID=UPI0027859260|nr:hypothetical protein [Paenibacillus anaericanus]MDQ0091641.1 hypothetical protein [Paenibacillus anaericanus]